MILTRPLTAQLELTHDCNLSCPHCYTEEPTTELQPHHYQLLARTLANEGVFHVTLTGGEPLTQRERLANALVELRDTETITTINSNLTLLTLEDVQLWQDSRVASVMTTLNSHSEHTHNKTTNTESFKQTLRGLEQLASMPTVVNMVVQKANKDDVYQTGKFVHGLGIKGFTIGHIVSPRERLTKGEVVQTLEQVRELVDETGLQFKLQIALPFCAVEPHLRPLLETSGCSAARTTVQINPYGEVTPCPMVRTSHGNVLTEGLDVIWERMSDWSGWGLQPP